MTVLQLYLTQSKPWSTNYCLEDGQVLYKAESPYKFTGRKVTLSKVVPSSPNDPYEGLKDTYAHVAEIELRAISPSIFRFDGIEATVDCFFRKQGRSWHGSNRIFKDSEGVEFAWKLCSTKCKLVLQDCQTTPVATFHRKHLGFLGKKPRPASIEIYPEGQHILDLIMMTFIYVEKLRSQRADEK